MKKFLALATLILCSLFVQGQTSTFSCSGTSALTTVNTYCQNSNGTNLLPSGTDTHNLYIIPEGTPGTITVLIQGSVKGDFSDAVTCGTSTTTTPNLLSCSGIYARVRAKLTVFTGFTAVNLTYVGTSSVTRKAGSFSISASAPIVVTPNPITGTGTVSCPTCAIGGSIASTTNVLKGNGTGSAVASSIVDDGTNPTKGPNGVSTENNGLYNLDTNEGSTGTAVNKFACVVDGTPNVKTCTTSTISGIAGVAEQGAGTTGSVELCTTICTVLFDNQTTAGDWGILSTGTAGEGHDTGATTQTAGPQNVFILSANSGAGTVAQVKVLTPDVVNPSVASQPGKAAIQINGTTVTKPILNINGTTPAAPASNTNCTWQSSTSGNTESASCYLPTALQVICASTLTFSPGTISSGACSSEISMTCTGLLTTDNVLLDFNADFTGTTGYLPGAMGTVAKYPVTDAIKARFCNNTSNSLTPTSVTFNGRGVR